MCAAVPGTRRARTLTRLAALPLAAMLLTAACAATETPPPVPVMAQGQLVTAVPDSLYDAGRASSVALDPDGHPVVAYLLLQPVLKKGQIPPPVIAGQAQPPAVMLATEDKGIWTRTSVTPQSTSPVKGLATGISNQKGQAGPVVTTSVVVDGQGKHHVAWSAADGLYYATDAAGSFGQPDKVVSGATLGASLTLDSGGSPWVSFYQGSAVKAAHQTGGSWAVAKVSSASVPSVAARTAIRAGTKGPVVAFGSGDTTMVARGTGGGWTSEDVPGPGGFAVSMDLDKDGNSHLAYYAKDGHAFHAHSIAGGPWQVNELEVTASTTKPDARWGSGMAVEDSGVHHIVLADTGDGGSIKSLSNKTGSFVAETVPNSVGGTNPSIAVSSDGNDLAISFFDAVNANLVVAVPAAEGLVIAYSPPATTAPPTAAPTTAACQPNGTTVMVVAPVGASGSGFAEKCYAAPAGKAFAIEFKNDDTGLPHNFEVIPDSSAATRLAGASSPSDIITGPDTATYKSKALRAGNYYFHCDIHPTTMNGQFVVA
jgi:plastocyanin